jgi:hypothetical protein
MLERELTAAGLPGVTITFDAPSRDRTAEWPSPALDVFLYDIHETVEGRNRSWQDAEVNGRETLIRPPLRLACTYAITAWTQTVLDEHRLLSQAVAILAARPHLPVDLLPPSLLVGDPPVPLATDLGHIRDEGRAEFWTAIGGQYKVSIEYTVTVPCDPDLSVARGHPVLSQAISIGDVGGAPRDATRYTVGGEVHDGDGTPLADVAVSIPDAGLVVTTDPRGRFVLRGVPGGERMVQGRSADGRIARATVSIPGEGVLLTMPVDR